jgi:hypothetical protein
MDLYIVKPPDRRPVGVIADNPQEGAFMLASTLTGSEDNVKSLVVWERPDGTFGAEWYRGWVAEERRSNMSFYRIEAKFKEPFEF